MRDLVRILSLAAVLGVGGAGCTFSDGGWFATLTPTLQAAWTPAPDREAGDGWQRLSNDYQVRLGTGELRLGEIALLGASGGGPTTFDPAAPPPGYTLCHNGHCHSSDGRLVPYAEIEAALGGGGGGLQAVVRLAGAGPLDLTAPGERPLACRPGCGLGRTRLVRASAPIERLAMEGSVRDAPGGARLAGELRWRWTLAAGVGDGGAAGPALESALDLPADREHDPDVRLRLAVALGAALLDGVDFAALTAAEGVIDLDLPLNEAGRARALANLTEKSFLTAAVARD